MKISIADPVSFVQMSLTRMAEYLESGRRGVSDEELASDMRYWAEVLGGRTSLPGYEADHAP